MDRIPTDVEVTTVYIPYRDHNFYLDVSKWLYTHMQGRYSLSAGYNGTSELLTIFKFNDPCDAVLFKLTWL